MAEPDPKVGTLPTGVLNDRPRVQARRVRPNFAMPRRRRWFRGDAFRTHFYNAYTLLLADEPIFVELLRSFLPRLKSNELKTELRGWMAQEASHGVQHHRAHRVFESLGLRHRAYYRLHKLFNYRIMTGLLGKRLTLAVASALESFNAMLGEVGLTDPDYFDEVDEELATLLAWHFAEEIEHRAVVYDVCKDVGLDGFTMRLCAVLGFWMYTWNLSLTTAWFAIQDGSLFLPSFYRGWWTFLFREERAAFQAGQYLRAYLRRDFHPLERRNDHLAARILVPGRVAPASA